MLCARRANHRRLRISATKEQHVLRLKKLDIDYILSVSDEVDRHQTPETQTRADVGREPHERQCERFFQLTIIVYHRDDRQNLFRDLFMQIKSQVKCKYLLSSSLE